jgi:hypothetical protein
MKKVLMFIIAMALMVTPALAEIPTLEDTMQDAFEGNRFARFYSFEGSEGDVVSISMVQDDEEGDLDPYLVLFDPSGNVLAANDDGGDVSFSALIEDVTLPEAGVYLVMATTYNTVRAEIPEADEPLGYTISISGVSAGESEDEFFALPLVIDVEQSYEDTQAAQFFVFEGQEGETLTLGAYSEDYIAFDPILFLFDPDGWLVAANDDFSDTSDARLDAVELPEDGNYTVLVAHFSFTLSTDEDWVGGGSFSFRQE